MHEWRAVHYGFIIMRSTEEDIYFQIDFYYSYFNKTAALCILKCVPQLPGLQYFPVFYPLITVGDHLSLFPNH